MKHKQPLSSSGIPIKLTREEKHTAWFVVVVVVFFCVFAAVSA